MQGLVIVRTQKIQAEQNKNTAGNVCSERKTGGQDGPLWSKRPVTLPVLVSLNPVAQGMAKRKGPGTVVRNTVRFPLRGEDSRDWDSTGFGQI